MTAVNPTTGATLQVYADHSDAAVEQALRDAAAVPASDRAPVLRAAARLLRERRDDLAQLMALEMGKPVTQGRAEAEKCAWVCDYYADHAPAFLAPQPVATEATRSWILFQPLGTLLAVMPWNFPFWQVFRFLAPALMAGNTGVLKHASNVSGCALAIEHLVRKAGFPENVFRTLLIGSKAVKSVIENPLIKAVSLTGSTPAGQSVASVAGSVLKKSVLELGGSDPYLILEDADIETASRLCVTSRLLNAGQSCIGAKRFIIIDKVYDQFKAEFVRLMSQAVYGDPLDPNTTFGPLARTDLRNELHQQVVKSVELGATVLLGGFIPEGKAPFYPATVLENVVPGMPAYHEELFGPVAVLFRVNSEEEAIRIANDTGYGLGAGIFTADVVKGKILAEKGLQAGCVFVNDFVKSNPRLPFGGMKESGYGRELSAIGIREFVNTKTVVVK